MRALAENIADDILDRVEALSGLERYARAKVRDQMVEVMLPTLEKAGVGGEFSWDC